MPAEVTRAVWAAGRASNFPTLTQVGPLAAPERVLVCINLETKTFQEAIDQVFIFHRSKDLEVIKVAKKS